MLNIQDGLPTPEWGNPGNFQADATKKREKNTTLYMKVNQSSLEQWERDKNITMNVTGTESNNTYRNAKIQ